MGGLSLTLRLGVKSNLNPDELISHAEAQSRKEKPQSDVMKQVTPLPRVD